MQQHGTSTLGATEGDGQHVQQGQEDGFHPTAAQFNDTNVPLVIRRSQALVLILLLVLLGKIEKNSDTIVCWSRYQIRLSKHT